MTNFDQESRNLGDGQWITAPDPDEDKLTGSDIAKGVAGFAAEVGVGLLQTLLSFVILGVCLGVGAFIGFFLDGGSIVTMGTMTIVLALIGLAAGFIINYKRGYTVFFF